MFKRNIAAFVAIFVLSIPQSSRVHAQAAEIAGPVLAGQAVGNILADIDERLSALLDNAMNGANDLQFSTLQQVKLAQSSLRNAYIEALDKSFEELNDAQREAFTNVYASIDKLSAETSDAAMEANKLVDNVAVAISRAPFSDSMPLVTRMYMKPSVLVGGAKIEHVQISASGSRLAHEKASMTIGDNTCERIGMDETKLVFKCPVEWFRLGSIGKISSETAFLTIPKKSSIWKGWFGIEEAPMSYEFPVMLVPAKMGDIFPKFVIEKQVEIVRNRKAELVGRNPHCARPRNVSLRVTADEGWKIKTDSIVWHQNFKSSKSFFDGFADVTQNGFVARAKVVNSGECVRAFGHVVSYDGRGSIGGTVTYQEYRIEKHTEPPLDGEKVELSWSAPATVTIPDGAISYTIDIVTIDNVSNTFAGADVGHWYDVLVPDSRTVIVKPKDVGSVLN